MSLIGPPDPRRLIGCEPASGWCRPLLFPDVSGLPRGGQQTVVAQRIVVVAVFLAEHQLQQALANETLHAVLATARVAVILKSSPQPPGQIDRLVGGSQHNGTAISGHTTAAERRCNSSPTQCGPGHRGSLRRHRTSCLESSQRTDNKAFLKPACPISPHSGERCGLG